MRLRGQHDLVGASLLRLMEQKLHDFVSDPVSAPFGERGDPRHERGTACERGEGEPAGAGRHEALFSHDAGQGNDAARVIRIGHPEVSNTLFLSEDTTPDGKSRVVIGSRTCPRNPDVEIRLPAALCGLGVPACHG